MYRKITAEFENVESAERAAKAIKEGVCEVKNITIKRKVAQKDNKNILPFYGYNMANTFSNPTGLVTPLMNGFPFVNGTAEAKFYEDFDNLSKNAKLEINCKQDDVRKITHLLTCYRGLKITQ